MRIQFSTAAIIAILVSVPTAGDAQAGCGYFWECSGSLHSIDDIPANNRNAHSNCDECIFEPSYPVCHPMCGVSFFDPAMRRGFEAVVAAAESRDVRLVLRLASSVPGYVLWNEDRHAVQITSCSQTSLLASLPVNDVMTLVVARNLPSVQLAFSGAAPWMQGKAKPSMNALKHFALEVWTFGR